MSYQNYITRPSPKNNNAFSSIVISKSNDSSPILEKHLADYNNPHKVDTEQLGLSKVAISGNYKDLSNTPLYGASLLLNIDSDNYVITAQLKDQNGNIIGSTQTIDLPLESVVVNGDYDEETKEVVLTLQNDNVVRFSVSDLVSGLQSEITNENKLDADLVDDTNSTNKFVTESEKETWNNKTDLDTVYTKNEVDEFINEEASQRESTDNDLQSQLVDVRDSIREIQYPENMFTGDDNVTISYGLDTEEYEQLDYLQSTGDSFIDLGIIPSVSSIFKLKFQVDNISSSLIISLYGYNSSDLSLSEAFAFRHWGMTPNNRFNLAYTKENGKGTSTDICGVDTDWHTFIIHPNYVKVDDISTLFFNNNSSTKDGTRSIGLFGTFSGMGDLSYFTPDPQFVGKIAYFQELRQNGSEFNVIHNFIAVRRKSDNILGFYDTITDTFVSNIGSKDFIAGPKYNIKVSAKPSSNSFQTVSSNRIQNNTIDARIRNTAIITGSGNTSYGVDSIVYDSNSTAIGYNSSAQKNGIALGANVSTGNAPGSIVIGYNSETFNNNDTFPSVVIGNNRNMNASGNENTGVVIVGGQSSINPYYKDAGNFTTLIGTDSYSTSYYSTIVGAMSNSSAPFGTALGSNASTRGTAAVAVGWHSESSSEYGISVGNYAKSQGGNSISIGASSIAQGSYGIALGQAAKANASYSIQLGYKGENLEANTLYVGFQYNNFKLLDGNSGTIPFERLSEYSPQDGYSLVYDGNNNELVWKLVESGGSDYTLPVATSNKLGGVKVGSGLSITNDGILSANVQSLSFSDITGSPKDNEVLSESLEEIEDEISNVAENINADISDLSSRVDNLSSIGQFLAIWDCDTGIARYLTDGYEYPQGGYFIIGAVANNISIRAEVVAPGRIVTVDPDYIDGWINYFGNTVQVVTFTMGAGQYGLDFTTDFDSKIWTKAELENDLGIITTDFNTMGDVFIVTAFLENYMPNGTTYTSPSSTVTDEEVKVSDMWFYDGRNWIYLQNHERAIAVDATLDSNSLNPVENKAITEVLNQKQDILTAGKGITISSDNTISASSDSVGTPQIANVTAKQINSEVQAFERQVKESYYGDYTDIILNLNLTKEQILDRMDDLYVGIERFKRNYVTIEDDEENETDIRYKSKFSLMNDRRLNLDVKAYCYRVFVDNGYLGDDPRNFIYFYTTDYYSDYNELASEDPTIFLFYGQWTEGNDTTNINTLRGAGAFSDWQDSFDETSISYYPEGDITTFINVNSDIVNRYLEARKARKYIINNESRYYWCANWFDPNAHVYSTSDYKIPDNYIDTVTEEVCVVKDLESESFEYEKRSDLTYYHLINSSEFYFLISDLNQNTLKGYEWGDTHIHWNNYWLDYPVQPVLLRDIEVLLKLGHNQHWKKLKNLSQSEIESYLPDNVVFRYPYNTTELWLRFCSYQKRCMYNEQNENGDVLPLSQKRAFAYAWNFDNGQSVFGHRAFGRQRKGYNSSEHAKISEYIRFNLYSPENVSQGTMSKSTPYKIKLNMNAANGATGLRD